MAMNMDAVLRIVAKVGGLADINNLQKGLVAIEGTAKTTADAFKDVVDSKAWQGAAVAAGAFGVAMGASIKAAIDPFQSAMADVRKVVDGLETPEALAEISNEILELSKQLPITAEGFAEIYAAAGQSGIAREELRDFAVMVGKVATAFDITAQEAGTALSQLKVALGLSLKEVESLADSMNYLSNNTGSTAANLVEFMTRAGAVGKLAGLSGQETAAFGAAMIETGIQAEVAGTSFNNMIKTLSAGTAMTDRQVGALERLGYAYRPAVVATRDYTAEAEAQSRQRLTVAREEADERVAIARNETDRLTREIDDRYRQIKQQLQDQWEDERDAREDAISEAGRRAGKALQREQQRELQQLNDQYDERLKIELARFKGRTDELADAEQEAIRKRYRDLRQQETQEIDDRYEAQRQELDKQNQQTLKVERRAARDRENLVIERLENQQRIESDGIKKQLDQIEKTESKRIEALTEAEKAKIDVISQQQKQIDEEQKRQAEQAADAWKLGFAERLQREGSSFIMEILKNISKLPEAEQVSVMSDLFGDEARGLAPMIANVERLSEVLKLSTDDIAAAGSVNQEYGVRAETTANQIQLLVNKQKALAIEMGTQALPAINDLLVAFDKLLTPLGEFAKANPQITGIAIAFGAVASALILLAPGLVATASLIKSIGLAFAGLKLGATIAGWAAVAGPAITAITAAFSGFLAFLTSTFLPAIVAFFSGPVGWTVLAVAAVVAMAVKFRKPIADFLLWLGSALKDGFTAAWEGVKAVAAAFSEWFSTNVTQPLQAGWRALVEFLPRAMQAAATNVVSIWTNVVTAVKNVFNSIMRVIENGINAGVNAVNSLINKVNRVSPLKVSTLDQFSLPQFAAGGYVTRPTIAQIGEGGEPEYVVPRSKAMSFANNIVQGRSGSQAIPAGRGGNSFTARPAVATASTPAASTSIKVQIQTGPVMELDGQKYVTYEDAERMVNQTADRIFAVMRKPAARFAQGRM